ncbi:copper transporter family protein [Aspergillus bombycis]|uniref:Copper transport protein n=1 Tax=Aspergillus bombycis TaxID=109264 RepID=A0A1F7ZUI9_9EURO|nr:copper transporter family protein [Aspergillus bombycis]OGM43124.1 copper transporter family protein [Aspergillus bombycis]
MDMSSMDHSSHSSSSSSSSSMTMSMAMVFVNAQDTPLFSSQWTPSSSGAYAGTCIFLIILSIIGRLLVAFKGVMEQHWLNAHLNRRYVAVAGKSTEAGRIDATRMPKWLHSYQRKGWKSPSKLCAGLHMNPFRSDLVSICREHSSFS